MNTPISHETGTNVTETKVADGRLRATRPGGLPGPGEAVRSREEAVTGRTHALGALLGHRRLLHSALGLGMFGLLVAVMLAFWPENGPGQRCGFGDCSLAFGVRADRRGGCRRQPAQNPGGAVPLS